MDVLHCTINKVRGSPTDLGRFLHGIVYLVRMGIPCRNLPPRFGHWNHVFRRYRRWCPAGVWKRLLVAVAEARVHLKWGPWDSRLSWLSVT